MKPQKPLWYEQPFRTGSVTVQRIPASSATYRVTRDHYWRGYLFPQAGSIHLLATVGRLIEVRTQRELESECIDYKAQLEPGSDKRLAYYEVIDADG